MLQPLPLASAPPPPTVYRIFLCCYYSNSQHSTCMCPHMKKTRQQELLLQRLHKHNVKLCTKLEGGCRAGQLRSLGLLPSGRSPRGLPRRAAGIVVPTASSRFCPSLDVEQSEAASSGSSPAPPWPTPAQLKQTLATFGRAQAQENAHILASRCCTIFRHSMQPLL